MFLNYVSAAPRDEGQVKSVSKQLLFWFDMLSVRVLFLLLVMNLNYVNYAPRDEGVMCVLFLLFWSLGVVDVDGTQHSQRFSL